MDKNLFLFGGGGYIGTAVIKHFERKKTSIGFTGYNQNPSNKKNEKLYLDNHNPYLYELKKLRQEIIKIQYGDEKYYKASQMKNLDKNAYINQIKTIQTKLKDIFISKDTNTLENQRKLKSQESNIIKLFFELVVNSTKKTPIQDYILNNVTSFDKYNSFYNELVEYNSNQTKYIFYINNIESYIYIFSRTFLA